MFVQSIAAHVLKPSLIICKLSVQVVRDDSLVVWSRGCVRAVGNERLDDRWGKPLIRKLKQREWVEAALLSDSTAHLICQEVDEVSNDMLVTLFDRYMPMYAISIRIVRHGVEPPGDYDYHILDKPEGPRVKQR